MNKPDRLHVLVFLSNRKIQQTIRNKYLDRVSKRHILYEQHRERIREKKLIVSTTENK